MAGPNLKRFPARNLGIAAPVSPRRKHERRLASATPSVRLVPTLHRNRLTLSGKPRTGAPFFLRGFALGRDTELSVITLRRASGALGDPGSLDFVQGRGGPEMELIHAI